MWAKLLLTIILALYKVWEAQNEESKKASVADRDPDMLRRIGSRVRELEDGARRKRESDQDGS